jgi:acetyl/propionyl-CoA carboxylase alpha subunit
MYKVTAGNKQFSIELKGDSGSGNINGAEFLLDRIQIQPGVWHVLHKNRSYTIISEGTDEDGKTFSLRVNGRPVKVGVKNKLDLLMEQMGFNNQLGRKVNEVKAPMPGLVLRTVVNEGDQVKKGDTLLVLEAMKMENTIKSPGDGEVSKIQVNNGQAVEKGQILITFR